MPSKELAGKHYAEHDGKPFFPKLVDFLSSGAVVATVWEGKEVVKFGRTMIGATNPLASAPGTIRYAPLCTPSLHLLIHLASAAVAVAVSVQVFCSSFNCLSGKSLFGLRFVPDRFPCLRTNQTQRR